MISVSKLEEVETKIKLTLWNLALFLRLMQKKANYCREIINTLLLKPILCCLMTKIYQNPFTWLPERGWTIITGKENTYWVHIRKFKLKTLFLLMHSRIKP